MVEADNKLRQVTEEAADSLLMAVHREIDDLKRIFSNPNTCTAASWNLAEARQKYLERTEETLKGLISKELGTSLYGWYSNM